MSSSYHEFQAQLAQRRLGASYILVGSDTYRIDEVLTALRDALLTRDFQTLEALPVTDRGVLVDETIASVLGPSTRQPLVPIEDELQAARFNDARRQVESFDYSSFQGREADVDEIVMQVCTPPMQAERRLVVVREFNRYRKDDQERLLAEVKKQSQFCRLVLTTPDDWRVTRLIASQGCSKFVVTIAPAEEAELRALVERWVKQNRIRVSTDARELLLEVSGGSLRQLRGELDKIRTFLGTGQEVGKETVRDLAGHWQEYQVSEFVDAVVRRDRSEALTSLRRLAEWGEEPVMIVGWLAGRFLRMLATGYGAWTRLELVVALRELARIDLSLKRGHPERFYLLEKFAIRRTTEALRRTAV